MILIAGNHDVLLDEDFLDTYPERRYGQTKKRADLDWGTITYLENSTATLRVGSRHLTVFGSPWTPRYGVSAFQYAPDSDVWDGTLPTGVDIVVAHGPPHLHQDARDFHRAGCRYLAAEIARVRPRLVVFGHIHAAYGREDVVLDGARRRYEEVVGGWAGWLAIFGMVADIAASLLANIIVPWRFRADRRPTTFVNASVVGGPENELRNEPIVVEL